MGSLKECFQDKKKSKIATIILYVLLVFSITMLCIELLTYRKPTVILDPTVSEDGILETNSDSLKLHYGNSRESLRMIVNNMMPGDSVMKMYSVEVFTKGDTNLFFKVKPKDKTDKLCEALRVRAFYADNDTVVYDGTVKDMPGHIPCPVGTVSDGKNVSAVNLELTFYLDLMSVGNEYQGESLEASFEFWVEDTHLLYLPGVCDLDIGIFSWALIVIILSTVIYILAFIIFRAISKKDDKAAKKKNKTFK